MKMGREWWGISIETNQMENANIIGTMETIIKEISVMDSDMGKDLLNTMMDQLLRENSEMIKNVG